MFVFHNFPVNYNHLKNPFLLFQSVEDLMKIIREEKGENDSPPDDPELIERVTAKFNNNLIFHPGRLPTLFYFSTV